MFETIAAPGAPPAPPARASTSGSSRTSRNWQAAIERLDGAYSPHTLRSYRADFAAFAGWCRKKRLPALPASPATVAAFLDAVAPELKTGTLKRRVAAIRKLHRLTGNPDPTDDEEVLLALRRARRKKPARPDQALGLTETLRDQLIAACPDDLRGLRDKALFAVGYDTLCRRSELVALRVEDIEARLNGGANILVRRAKNDMDGNGRIAAISAAGLARVRTWLAAAEIDSGPIFRPVFKNVVKSRSLHPAAVSRLIKAAAGRAGIGLPKVEKLSGHSMRVGCAQDLNRHGFDLLTIMRAGGWRSVNVVARYIEKVDLTIWD